jgi:hypothetical protein
MKVDNVDLMQPNIRILNAKGEPSYKGRVEMRVGGIWHTFSKIGT